MDIDGFINHLMARTRSAETLRAYRGDLEKFQDFLKANRLRDNQVNQVTVTQFLNELSANSTRKKSGQLAPASDARRLAVISSYYEYRRGQSNGRISNPVTLVTRPKVDNVQFRAASEQNLEQLLAGIPIARDKALLTVFLSSGLRLSEVYQLDKSSISRRQRTLPNGKRCTVGFGEVVGKGGKRRMFLVDEGAIEAVVAYLRERGPDQEPALFTSLRGGRLERRTIQDVLDRYCKRLGISHIHIHQLRHTFATRMVNAGMPSIVLKELMGHASFNTTQRYFKIRPERLAREFFAAWEFIQGD